MSRCALTCDDLALECFTKMPGHTQHHNTPLSLLTARERALQNQLDMHVEALAGENGARTGETGPERAAQYVESELQKHGYSPARQTFDYSDHNYANIQAEVELAEVLQSACIEKTSVGVLAVRCACAALP